MNLIDRLVRNFKYSLAGQIISLTSGTILTVALARLLDPNEYGLLFLAISIFGIIKIFSTLGIPSSTAKHIAEFKQTDRSKIRPVLRFSFILNVIAIIFICLLTLFSSPYIINLINEPNLKPFLFIGILFLSFSTLYTYVRRILQGFEAITISAVLRAINTTSRLILVISLVLFGFGAIGAFVGYILSFALTVLIGLGYLYRVYYKDMRFTDRSEEIYIRITKYAVPLSVTNAANKLENKVDTVLVGFFLDPVAVAYYTIGKKIITFLETPVTALGFTLSPTYEAQTAKGNDRTAAHIYKQALSNSLVFYIPASAGLIILSEQIINLLFGAEYFGAVPVLQVLGIYAVLRSIMQITGNGLDYLGHAKIRAIAQGITAVLNVILNIIFIPEIGVLGAAISTVITYSIYTLINLYIIIGEFGIRVQWLSRVVGKILGVTIVMSVIVYRMVDMINGFATLFFVIGVGTIIWGTLSIVIGLINIHQFMALIKRQ